MKFEQTNWKSLGAVEYNRRLSAYLSRVRSGVDRGNDEASVEYVQKLFGDLEQSPVDHAIVARDEAGARKLEDGE